MVAANKTPSLIASLIQPTATFQALAKNPPSALKTLLVYSLWLALLPPVFAWYGAYVFGWRLGASEPLVFSPTVLTIISVAYFITLFFGLFSTG
jgi:hypothetical protein